MEETVLFSGARANLNARFSTPHYNKDAVYMAGAGVRRGTPNCRLQPVPFGDNSKAVASLWTLALAPCAWRFAETERRIPFRTDPVGGGHSTQAVSEISASPWGSISCH